MNSLFGSFWWSRFLSLFFYFEKSRYTILSCLWSLKVNIFCLFRRGYFYKWTYFIRMNCTFVIKETWMILLFLFLIRLLRLKAKLHNFWKTGIFQKSKMPTSTLMKINIKVWSVLDLLWGLYSNWLIVFWKQF